jgi:eukaryotic-like serine/threonine-protein kinase
MLSGQVPFPGPSLPEKLLGHQSLEPTPLYRTVPGLPEGLSEIVRRMMQKSPDERYATALQVAQALGPFGYDHTGGENGDGGPPILEPLDEPAPQLSELADDGLRALASVKAAIGQAGRESPRGVAAIRDPRPDAADPAAPLLTPDDEYDEIADDVRLILDPDPEPSPSEDHSRPEPRSSTDGSASADVAAQPAAWLASVGLWGLIVLAAMVTVLVVILARFYPPGRSSGGPAAETPALRILK